MWRGHKTAISKNDEDVVPQKWQFFSWSQNQLFDSSYCMEIEELNLTGFENS